MVFTNCWLISFQRALAGAFDKSICPIVSPYGLELSHPSKASIPRGPGGKAGITLTKLKAASVTSATVH